MTPHLSVSPPAAALREIHSNSNLNLIPSTPTLSSLTSSQTHLIAIQLCMLPGRLCSLQLWPSHSLITAVIYPQYLWARTHKYIF